MNLDQRLSQRELRVVLQPRAVELISRRDIRIILREYRSFGHLMPSDHVLENARKIIYQTCFTAFLAGKNKAADEAHIRFWSIEENDLPIVKWLRSKYIRDFEYIAQDLLAEIRFGDIDSSKTLRRCDILLQMLTWESYNKGKLALWDDEILKPELYLAQAYKYEGYWMYQTAADERVCELCAPLAGMMVEDPHELEMPPLHVWCRCEIVAIPTVHTLEEQEQFLKHWWEKR